MTRTVKKVNLKKQAEFLIFCYQVYWIPFSIVAELMSSECRKLLILYTYSGQAFQI